MYAIRLLLFSCLSLGFCFYSPPLSLSHHERRRRVAAAAKKGRRKLRDLTEESTQKFIPIPGISPPVEGKLKGWELGPEEKPLRLVAARINGKIYVFEAACSRCSWDLNKGQIIDNHIVCALCGQSYNLKNGKPGPFKEINQGPVASFVANLGRRAPTNKPAQIAQSIKCKLDEDDNVLLDFSSGSFLASKLAS